MKRQRKTYFRKENRYFNSTWFVIEFVVSKKNYHQINNYVLNNLALEYKRKMLKDYIDKKIETGGWSSLVKISGLGPENSGSNPDPLTKGAKSV